MSYPEVVIVGAGPGGLAAGMLLVSAGYPVKIYEKQKQIGGRTSRVEVGAYKFDLGPTFFLMPDMLKAVFQAAGRRLEDYVELIPLDPLYMLQFGTTRFFPTASPEAMMMEIERVFPGESDGYRRFMKEEKKVYSAMQPLFLRPFEKMTDYLGLDMWKAFPYLKPSQSVYDRLSRYFKTEQLKWAFSFQAKYLGMSAWKAPAPFTMLSLMEHLYGLYHPVGGMNRLCEAMARVIEEYGGEIFTGEGVDRVAVDNGTATGVVLEDGTFVEAGEVIVNADYGHAVTHLFDKKDLKKHRPEKLGKRKLSCSTFMMYLGLDGKVALPHHSVIFAADYKKNVEELTEEEILSDDFSYYVHNPSALDPTLAPPGKTALYVLIPVPNLDSGIDWEKEAPAIEESLLDRLEKLPELADIRNMIEEKKTVTPLDWEKDYFVYKGATFNLSHSLDQMMRRRPHNKFEDIDHVYLVGGGTHPGSGLPTIFSSALISTGMIRKVHERNPEIKPVPLGE